MSSPVFFYFGGLAFLSALVARSDYVSQRIPNRYLGWGLAYGLAVTVFFSFEQGAGFAARSLFMSLFGMFIGFLMLLPGYVAKQVAAGDVKFMMVIGFFLGPKGAAVALLFGAMVGGAWAIWLAWRVGGLARVWHNMKFMWNSLWLSGLRDLSWDLGSDGAIKMPYGVALAAGCWIVIVWQLSVNPVVRAWLGLAE